MCVYVRGVGGGHISCLFFPFRPILSLYKKRSQDFNSLFNLYLDFCLDKTGRRNRTTYKRWQIDELERAFSLNPYPTSVFKKTLALRLGLRDSRVQVIFVFAFIKELTRTKLLLFIRSVINGKDLASSRCIKGMKKNHSSQAPLRASIFLSIFL